MELGGIYDMKFLIGCYNKSVILTYVGIAFAIFGMMFVDNLKIALICLMVAGICDLFDGKIARMCKRTEQEKEFGVQIDSLCDVISSLLFPTVILNQVGIDYNISKYLIFGVSVLYVLAGITRLAWFNITTTGKMTHFQGLPVTAITIILPLLFLIFKDFSSFGYIIVAGFIATAIAFVVNMPVKKPSGKGYIVLLSLAIIATVFVYLR